MTFDSAPALAEMLIVLRASGVREFRSGDFVIVFDSYAPKDIEPQRPGPLPTSVTLPSAPEQSGKADAFTDEKPEMNIFDIIESGVIPGAPGAVSIDPGSS